MDKDNEAQQANIEYTRAQTRLLNAQAAALEAELARKNNGSH